MEYLTQREWERFIGAVESARNRAMLTVAYWRGLRASELGREYEITEPGRPTLHEIDSNTSC